MPAPSSSPTPSEVSCSLLRRSSTKLLRCSSSGLSKCSEQCGARMFVLNYAARFAGFWSMPLFFNP
jgi:hypothetical protein